MRQTEVTRLKRLAGPQTPPEAYFCVCDESGKVLGWSRDPGDPRSLLDKPEYERLLKKQPPPARTGDNEIRFVEADPNRFAD